MSPLASGAGMGMHRKSKKKKICVCLITAVKSVTDVGVIVKVIRVYRNLLLLLIPLQKQHHWLLRSNLIYRLNLSLFSGFWSLGQYAHDYTHAWRLLLTMRADLLVSSFIGEDSEFLNSTGHLHSFNESLKWIKCVSRGPHWAGTALQIFITNLQQKESTKHIMSLRNPVVPDLNMLIVTLWSVTPKCLLYILRIWGEMERDQTYAVFFLPALIACNIAYCRFQNTVSIRMELSRQLMGVHIKILTDLTSWLCLPALIIGWDFL